jgi:hypothetical protein
MGDKSPKSTNKKAGQKQAKSNQAQQKKKKAEDARRVISPKK